MKLNSKSKLNFQPNQSHVRSSSTNVKPARSSWNDFKFSKIQTNNTYENQQNNQKNEKFSKIVQE